MTRLTLSRALDPLRDLRRTWPQLIATDLVSRAVALLALTPLVGLLLRLFLLRTETGVLSDQDILSFALSPMGFATVLVVGGVSLGILFAELGVLMVIGFGAVEDRSLTWLDAIRCVARRAPQLAELGGHVVVRVALLAAPFVAALAGVYALLLGTHDINFYLAERPPAFRTAVLAAALIGGGLAVLLAVRVASWILAIPLVLFEGARGRAALRVSSERTAGSRIRIALWLLGWGAAVIALSFTITFVVGLAGDLLVPRDPSHVGRLVAGLSVTLALSGLGNAAVWVLATIVLPLLLVRVYRLAAGPGKLPIPLAPRGSLGDRATLRVPGALGLVGIGVALVAAGFAGDRVLRRIAAPDRAEIIAHRGGAAVAPENTMAAFKRAIEAGADWIELDVQENADGVVVVEHDRDFMRVAGRNLTVWEATNEDLLGIDIGSRFAPEFADQRVPTLREVLELARGHLGVFIELKYYGHDRELESKVVDLVESTGMVDHIVVMSLKYDGLRKTRELRPEWTYGLLTTVSVGDPTRMNLDFLAVNAETATLSLIRRAHARGKKVHVWTVNDPVQMSIMMSRGVDGIITDNPALAVRVKRVREEIGSLGRLVFWAAGEARLLRGLEESSLEEEA
jgi:glycerophosphoryl diester phosphodiesterase